MRLPYLDLDGPATHEEALRLNATAGKHEGESENTQRKLKL